jgi:hypothetical protein
VPNIALRDRALVSASERETVGAGDVISQSVLILPFPLKFTYHVGKHLIVSSLTFTNLRMHASQN